MNDPTVVGIPIGSAADSAVSAAVGSPGSAVGSAVSAAVSSSPIRGAVGSAGSAVGIPGGGAGDSTGSTGSSPGGSPNSGALGAMPTENYLKPPLASRRPIFHAIGERVPEAPAAGGSHLEVGVRGGSRGSTLPPKAELAVPEARHPGRALAFASLAAVVVGSGFLVRALTLADPVPPPLPPAWANRAVGAVGHRAAPLGYARPTRVTVTRVGIHANVLALGLAQDGEIGVPPAKEPLMAAWYDRGPAPGQAGPAVITGHVDSRFAPGNRAAFYELGAVRPGDDVDVARADRRVAEFRVDSVALVPKTGFPTREVYGPTGYAALRLITCGGRYDRRTGYADNVIVYAHLVGSR
ncbi:class F sortase [Catenulispora sp. NL8]|uniref:Class F sortase n=1 Tax=Catenulispora pinistramenti TaxID=2705254 RepID=A0ABS5L2H8_9ACTN|nr:class F sortase [Catenulispora pinistramenti]MBS2552543.1 class F sortase [Catenulispora pinistramenti]